MTLQQVLARLKGKRILVIGDVVIDHYIYGTTSRVSREAPVIVVNYNNESFQLGGAANVARNIKDLGGKVCLVSIIGNDDIGQKTRQLFKKYKISFDGLISPSAQTHTKTRILAGAVHTRQQQVLRLDRENRESYTPKEQAALLKKLKKKAAWADAVLVSDYGLSVISSTMIEELQKIAKKGRLVIADSRYQLGALTHFTAVTPNTPEVEALVDHDVQSQADVSQVGTMLLQQLQTQAVLLKRGKNGMALFCRGQKPRFLSAFGAKEALDVTGAGDTVIAAFTLALAAQASYLDAAFLANCAAGISVTKMGAATVTPKEIRQAVARFS